MTKKKIVVVDDEESFLILIKKILEVEGFEVNTAKNGHECLKIVKKEMPDLMIIDIMMRGMNGIDLAERIRSDPSTRKTKIVFLTVVLPNEVESERLKKVKPLDYIGKPFENEVLVAKVKKFTK